MDIQVNMERVLVITREKLAQVTQENIMLQAVAQEQQDEINQLKKTLDRVNERNLDKEEKGNGTDEG